MNTRAQPRPRATPRTPFFFGASCALAFLPSSVAPEEVEFVGRETWEGLSYTHRKEHVRAVGEAKWPETRPRRIGKSISMLAAGKKEFP